MKRWHSTEFPEASIADNAVIEGEEVSIAPGARIESGVFIAARRVSIGWGTVIERDTSVRGLGRVMEDFTVGDQAFIGFANQILAPAFAMGDYSQLHNSGLSSGYKDLSLGHNCWVGQNSILNCTERLSIGNNVRIGTGSQLWTHVASGELLEGCTLYGENPLTLEDNVWVVGGGVISPGLTLGRNTIVMTGSVLTKSTKPFHSYAGVPAKDVSDKLNFWKPISDREKAQMMIGFIADFKSEFPQYSNAIQYAEQFPHGAPDTLGQIVVALTVSDWDAARQSGISLFDISSKTYLKQRSMLEAAWIRWLVGYRARFLPRA